MPVLAQYKTIGQATAGTTSVAVTSTTISPLPRKGTLVMVRIGASASASAPCACQIAYGVDTGGVMSYYVLAEGWVSSDADSASNNGLLWTGRLPLSDEFANYVVPVVRNDTGGTLFFTVSWVVET